MRASVRACVLTRVILRLTQLIIDSHENLISATVATLPCFLITRVEGNALEMTWSAKHHVSFGDRIYL